MMARFRSALNNHRGISAGDRDLVGNPTGLKKLDFGWVPLFGVGISVFTALAFGAGTAYRQTYLGRFGFSEAAIPWSFQDTVYLGVAKNVLSLLLATLGGLFTTLVIMVIAEVLGWLGSWLSAWRQNKWPSPAAKAIAGIENPTLDVGLFCTIAFVVLFLFVLLTATFMAQVERQGKNDADQIISNITSGKQVQLPHVTIERTVAAQHIVEDGYEVGCSDRACGLISNRQGKIDQRLVPLDNVTSFRTIP